ncbi:MAG: MOSC domain-containing protein [Marmoricola sp.]
MSVVVTGLAVHPVKSTAIRPLQRATVHPWGLAGDRRWMVVDADGTLVSARELHELFLVTADTPETEPGLPVALRLRARGFDPVDVSEPDADLVPVRLHANALQGRPAAQDAHDWISNVTGRRGLRLIWCDDPTRRTFQRDWAVPTDHAPYTDSCPITLASLSSLRQLDDWIAQEALERGEEVPAALPIGRFRPNVVVDGAEAFAEDGWARLRIGDVRFRQPKRVDRCVMTTISPTDLTTSKEPIRTLARYRLADQLTWFAVHLVPEGPGTISVGDEVVPD